MKLPPKAGQRLLVPGILGVALIIAGAAAVAVTDQLLSEAQTELNTTQAEREQAQASLARATDQEREIREELVDYRKLLDRDMIGQEHRLDWVDRIAEIKAARGLLDVNYSIEPQRPVDYLGMGSKGEVEFLASPMKLDMALLHEEDLFRFIGDLRSTLSAYVVVRACTLNRAEGGPTDRGIASRLHASCNIDLVTIHDRQAKRT